MEKRRKISKNKCLILLSVVIGIMAIILVTIISNQNKTFSCTQTSDQPNLGYKTETTIKIFYNDNQTKRVKSTKNIETNNKEKLDELVDNYTSQYDLNNTNYGGYSKTSSKTDDMHATFIGEIDYEKVDMQKFIEDNPAIKQYTDNGKLTKDGTKRMYEASGFICKE